MKRVLWAIVIIICALLCIGLCSSSSVVGKLKCYIKGNHILGGYNSNDQYCWQTCMRCGEVINKAEHDFEENITESKRQCNTCGYSQSFSDCAYKVTFTYEDTASIIVYDNGDYTAEGAENSVAYSRDGNIGELLKDGNGQVYFKVVVNDGYFVSDIKIDGEYEVKKTVDEESNFYRIEGIESDLAVIITVLPLSDVDVIYNFASVTKNDGSISFKWDLLDGYSVIGIVCEVSSGDFSTNYYLGEVTSWTYWASTDTLYSFNFSAISDNEAVSFNDYSCSRYTLSNADNINFARVEINTRGGVFPSCDYVLPPSGYSGGGIINAEYVPSTISVYDSSNTLQYSVADNSEAKIRIRGNTSAYSENPSYKVKLSTATDFLAGFVERKEGINYADEEWLLLKIGDSLDHVVGSAVNQYLGTQWSPAYTYVALFMNGDYRGLYILCEAINEGNSDGDDYSKMPIDDDGYIIELDAYWWNEDLWVNTNFTQDHQLKYTFKYPDSKRIDWSSEEYLYIGNYMNVVEQKIINNADDLDDYIDIESFAIWLLTHDYLSDSDCLGSNIYFYKRNSGDSLLCMGPTWDYDSIYCWGSENYSHIHGTAHAWFSYLFENDSFMAVYKDLFVKTKDSIISYIEASINDVKTAAYDNLLAVDEVRWGVSVKSVQEIIDFFAAHIEWMSSQLLE